MGACIIQTVGGGQIVRRISVDEATLDKVAEALGMAPAERAQFISGTQSMHIYRGPKPAAGAPESQPSDDSGP